MITAAQIGKERLHIKRFLLLLAILILNRNNYLLRAHLIKFHCRDLGVDVVGYYLFYFKSGNKSRSYPLFICDDSINAKCNLFLKSNTRSSRLMLQCPEVCLWLRNRCAHLDLAHTFTIKLLEYFPYRFLDLRDLKPKTTRPAVAVWQYELFYAFWGPSKRFSLKLQPISSWNTLGHLGKAEFNREFRRSTFAWIGLLLSARITADHPAWNQEIQLGQIVWLVNLDSWKSLSCGNFCTY